MIHARTRSPKVGLAIALLLLLLVGAHGASALPPETDLPPRLRDRGTGVPSSMFGTYLRDGEVLIYPFFEYSRDSNLEYDPAEWGFGTEQEHRGKFDASEGLIFIGYGLSDRIAFEFEASTIDATFEKASDDSSSTPSTINESGLGDVSAQIRLRLSAEYAGRPEIFGFLDVSAPTQRDKLLIGDRDWEIIPGIGFIRGYSWGTMTLRTTAEYNQEESKVDVGETAIEYLRRLSPAWLLFLAIEGGEGGGQDEWTLIPELQWRIADSMLLKLNSGFGLSSKATDWEPEIGLMFSLPFGPEGTKARSLPE